MAVDHSTADLRQPLLESLFGNLSILSCYAKEEIMETTIDDIGHFNLLAQLTSVSL